MTGNPNRIESDIPTRYYPSAHLGSLPKTTEELEEALNDPQLSRALRFSLLAHDKGEIPDILKRTYEALNQIDVNERGRE